MDEELTARFFNRVFRVRRRRTQAPEGAPGMSGSITLRNKPEFWADAPWRLEPDQDELPVSFHVRDADIQPPGKGPWRMDMLRVEQRLADGSWHKLLSLLPADVPEVDDQGFSPRSFWVHGAALPRSELHGVGPGSRVHLRVLFVGSFPPHRRSEQTEIHLETLLAEHPLPKSRAAREPGARQWFYGDTHYHSAYTNDVKEFGGAVPEARRAGQAVGLDWLVITDHSCDLDEEDGRPDGRRRWELLKADLASPAVSDGRFRCILGEEITLIGEAGAPLHMLAFGSLDQMVEGAFLPVESDKFAVDAVRTAIQAILDSAEGFAPGIPDRLFGVQHPLAKVLAMLPAETLVFAAHPYDVAQVPPARWGESDLTQRRLTGYEFWNGRIRASGKSTYNPFDLAAWKDPAKLQAADAARIAKLKVQAKERWDPQLQIGVRDWAAGAARPAWRPVFIGGADAHCDFNYHVGWAWDYRKFDADDDALGRVRTAVFLPDHAGAAVPEVERILAAVKKGSCAVTDGPLVEAWLEHGAQRAALGDTLEAAGGGDLELKVTGHSTPEFGLVAEIEVVSYLARGDKGKAQRTAVQAGIPATVDLGPGRGYLRVEAQTTGASGESFCCFTNPIWLRLPDAQPRRLRITLG